MTTLIVNVGSTSFKYKLYNFQSPSGEPDVLAEGRLERIGDDESPSEHRIGSRVLTGTEPIPSLDAAVEQTIALLTDADGPLSSLEDLDAVGFKAVHIRREPGTYLLDAEALERMADFQDVAPGHNPAYIRAVESFGRRIPGVPLIGAFESAFHRTVPAHATTYGVPYDWTVTHGIRRYGFHGASHSYIARRVPELLFDANPETLRIASCHLGGSSSLCAIQGGQSVDTTMGFSPQEGLLNATRTGTLDAFAVLYAQERMNLTPGEIGRILTAEGGLLGISGISGDMRDLETASRDGHARAQLAIDAYCYGVRKGIGGMTAGMGGLDVLAFTGGIGERSASVRQDVCASLGFLGVMIDEQSNRAAVPDATISATGSATPVLVIKADEELMVAAEVLTFLDRT